MNLPSEFRSGRSVVHVLDEWAKLAPDTNGRVFGSDWLSRTDLDLPYFPRMQKTSGYRIGFAALLGMKDFSGLQAVAADRYSAYPDFGCW